MTDNEFSIVYDGPVGPEPSTPAKPSELPAKAHFEKLYGAFRATWRLCLVGITWGNP
jgi:hypothetical protein